MQVDVELNGKRYSFSDRDVAGPGRAVAKAGAAPRLEFATAAEARRFLNRFAGQPQVLRRLCQLLGNGAGAPLLASGLGPQEAVARVASGLSSRRLLVLETVMPIPPGHTATATAEAPPPASASSAPTETRTSWIEFRVVDDSTGQGVAGIPLPLEGPGHRPHRLVTRADGSARLDGIDPGAYSLKSAPGRARLASVWAYIGKGEGSIHGMTSPEGPGEPPSPLVAGPDAMIFPEGAPAAGGPIVDLIVHRASPSDSIASLAKAHDLGWQDLARFNWGTAEPREINRALALRVGCTQRTADGKNYKFDDSDRPGLVFIPDPVKLEGLATETVHVLRVRRPPVQKTLESRYALEQLTGLADFLSRDAFRGWILSIFGTDVPIQAVDKLRNALADGEFENPPLDLVPPGELEASDGQYDKKRQRIQIDRELPEMALEDADAAGKLFFVLVHEFGHHVDQALRMTYSTIGGDAAFEEGAAYAHAVALLKRDESPRLPFAEYFDGSTRHRLELDFKEFPAFAEKYAGEDLVYWDTENEFHAHFGAGPGHGKPGMSFGHESIEALGFGQMAPEHRFNEQEIKEIYFGNWTRDYSQAVDPKLIRREDDPTGLGITRKAMTEIVNVLAELHFIDPKHDPGERRRAVFSVNTHNLGVYRAEEHIDNPAGMTDGRNADPDFRGDCTDAEIKVDPQRAALRFIATPGAWVTSTSYISRELTAAAAAGPTSRGRYHFGNGLHTLEDFFAHSNFCELALRKVGYGKVDPWVPVKPGERPPLVTGVFGGLDTAASILYVIGESLSKSDPFEPGKRTSSQRITLILLRDLWPNWASLYELYLKTMEDFKETNPFLWQIMYYTVGAFSRFVNFILGNVIASMGAAVKTAQTLFDESSTSGTNPTHTQIAKDHDDHPFHVLAAQLAAEAVRRTGEAMWAAWNNGGAPPATAERERIPHKVKAGESIDSLARGVGITWQELARFNWGTAVPTEINIHLRDEVGCTRKTADGYNYMFSDDDDPGIIYLPGGEAAAPGPVDVGTVATSFLVHPDFTDWMDPIVREWAKANPGKVAAGERRVVNQDEWDKLLKQADEWKKEYGDWDKFFGREEK